jgi:hypothetical protein
MAPSPSSGVIHDHPPPPPSLAPFDQVPVASDLEGTGLRPDPRLTTPPTFYDPPMIDPRVQKLAHVLVNYSTEVKPGDLVAIGGGQLAQPLLLAVYEEVLRAGGNPVLQVSLPAAVESLYELASEQQLDFVNPIQTLLVEEADVNIGIGAVENSRALTAVDPE